jgi:5-formyltetrahydrofolate cyclo-ligase
MNITEAKNLLRTQMREKRNSLSAERDAASRSICEHCKNLKLINRELLRRI